MLYITENNGVYGLTKGQFSATADNGSKSKAGGANNDSPARSGGHGASDRRHLCGAQFLGRQEAARAADHGGNQPSGPAFIDVISPCVAFNNHPGSTKSFDFVRQHNEAVNRLDYIEPREPITVDYAPGTVSEVTLHDGSMLRLAKLHPEYDPHDRIGAMTYMQSRAAAGELVTGLIYMDPHPRTCMPCSTRWTGRSTD